MEKSMKVKLLLYGLISAMSFSYLILPENSGISVPVFIILQFICLWFVVPNRKKLWVLIPIFILSMNSFISTNAIWRVSNFIVVLLLYIAMFLDFNIKDTTSRYFISILENLVEPLRHIDLPFKWFQSADKERAAIIKRVLLALIITIPSILILVAVLSSADSIFSKSTIQIFKEIIKFVSVNSVLKIFYGIIAGFYLFGLIYSAYSRRETEPGKEGKRQGDLIILNIFLISILAIYTIFVVIQFKYLFANLLTASSQHPFNLPFKLPFNLSFTEYARKGFFELLALSGVNIVLILITIRLTKQTKNVWAKVTKWLCFYLCAITIVLLASSLYRMNLYNIIDGLTRLRFMVFGFLIFESIGLLITFLYIFKPKFNIVSVYLIIALVYYLLLNVVPMDYFVAKSQIDRYINDGKANGIAYALTLSADAAPQIERLFTSTSSHPDKNIVDPAKNYFKTQHSYYTNMTPRWQRYNKSTEYSEEVYRRLLRDEAEFSHIKTK
ncbi:MAG: DUF4173 domain-containing protein [Clostridia bacterium]